MRKQLLYSLIGLLSISAVFPKSPIQLKSEASAWATAAPDNQLSGRLGGRLLFEADYVRELSEKTSFDMEVSANVYGTFGFHPFDSSSCDWNAKPYRLWSSYSGDQFELRAGLQKINFGSASLLRPLQWFDSVDPRDPLQLTDGVWGVLGRYYFLDNTNAWLWILYGNKGLKGIDLLKTENDYPEIGGRVQTPVGPGEIALSYNFRMASVPGEKKSRAAAEHKLGVDGKWDVGVGIWFEASISGIDDNTYLYADQAHITGGIDYTFGVGSGLNIGFEHLISSYDQKIFQFNSPGNYSALTINYPLGILDQLSGVFTYDWRNGKSYNFLNFKRAYDDWTIYLMAFLNPKRAQLPTGGSFCGALLGKGAQIMVVYVR